ncbi:MAG: threonine/serine dehydratase [Luteitalea sp.]|nr:threonine/serine dehydratase [Luteitalea sp.]
MVTLVDRIVAAAKRIQPHTRETRLERSDVLAPSVASDVCLKCENLQHTGSFKLRGALNKTLLLSPETLARGVVAASTGNHGRGVAHALAAVGGRGTIYLPTTAPGSKVEALRQYASINLEFHGTDSSVTEAHAREVAERSGRVYISPYNDLDVIAGQGTVGVEIWRQCSMVEALFVAVGGGGLVTGVASYLKAQDPSVRIIGCWPEHAPALHAALTLGRIVEIPERPTLSDATAGGLEPGAVTFDLARELIDDHVLVSEDEIAAAIRLVHAEHDMVIEGAAGVAVAGYRKAAARYSGQRSAIILCGGNIARSTLTSLLSA